MTSAVPISAAVALLSVAVVLPYFVAGPGFFLDDWGDLARIERSGWLRQEGWGKLASRPGAWLINTVAYAALGRSLIAWMIFLTVIAAATAVMLVLVLRRFVTTTTAGGIAALWVLLPDHTSLRVFPNCAPIACSLLALLVGLYLLGGLNYPVGALVLCAGGFCYEAVLLPALVGVVIFHRWKGWGTTQQAQVAAAGLVVTGALMSIHPTYSVVHSSHGTPRFLLGAHFAGGLTQNPDVAFALGTVASIGVIIAACKCWRSVRIVGSGPWLVAVGVCVMVCGLAAFVLRFPVAERGVADRNYVVSSVGAALVWWGVGRVLFERWRPMLIAAGTAFAVVLVSANVRFQRDWSEAANDTVVMLHRVDDIYRGHPPPALVIGPGMPHWQGVGAINTFFVPAASVVVVGHRMTFRIDTDNDLWATVPARERLAWSELLHP